eukprot:scaffold148651_cov31-Tisochrysis_lutea.AAC.8
MWNNLWSSCRAIHWTLELASTALLTPPVAVDSGATQSPPSMPACARSTCSRRAKKVVVAKEASRCAPTVIVIEFCLAGLGCLAFGFHDGRLPRPYSCSPLVERT